MVLMLMTYQLEIFKQTEVLALVFHQLTGEEELNQEWLEGNWRLSNLISKRKLT